LVADAKGIGNWQLPGGLMLDASSCHVDDVLYVAFCRILCKGKL
jgi:hypothetical protein